MARSVLVVGGLCDVAALGGRAAYQLMVQNGRLLLRAGTREGRLEALHETDPRSRQ
jgi:hypothetical protein